MTRLRFAAPLCVTLLAPAASRAQQPSRDTTAGSKIGTAAAAAKRWLTLVDSARYDASWDSAGTSFRHAISQAAWREAVVAARSPVDPLGARNAASAQYTRDLPNAPPGEYVVFQFSTAARGNARVIETVVLGLDTDGAWRVVGYFVKRA